jgi:UDP-glucose 4-epimerase
VFSAITSGSRPTAWGADYPTPDGTCVRDYVHVQDIADAHVLLAEVLDQGSAPSDVYNVGTGRGASVLEVIDAMKRHTGLTADPEFLPRREGDPARIVGSADRLRDELGWSARYDLDEMVSTAWEAWQLQAGQFEPM